MPGRTQPHEQARVFHDRFAWLRLQGHLEEFRRRSAALVAISVDPPGRSRALAERLGVTFPLLSDEELAAIRAYGVEDAENGVAWPAIFIVGRDGRIAWRSLAETYRERPAAKVVLETLDGIDQRRRSGRPRP